MPLPWQYVCVHCAQEQCICEREEQRNSLQIILDHIWCRKCGRQFQTIMDLHEHSLNMHELPLPENKDRICPTR